MGKTHDKVQGYLVPGAMRHGERPKETGGGLMRRLVLIAGEAGIDSRVSSSKVAYQNCCRRTSWVLWIPGWQVNLEAWAHRRTLDLRSEGTGDQEGR